MLRILVLYAIFSCLLMAYGREVSPLLRGMTNITLFSEWLLASVLILPLRLLMLKRHRESFRVYFVKDRHSSISLPVRELLTDFILWMSVGIIVAGLTVTLHQIHWVAVFQVLFGCLVAGMIIGMFNFLDMEKELLDYARENPDATMPDIPRLRVSVGGKVTFVLASVMIVSALVIGFMLLDDVLFIVKHYSDIDVQHFYEIFYEVGTVSTIMLALSVGIMGRLSRNIHMLFRFQIDALRQVEDGVYDTRIPVASTDEFGIIAAQTNEMIIALKERERIHETFGKYVTKEIRDLVLSGKVPVEGEERNVTILFCDIRKFTSFVEITPPKEAVAKLNQYFAEMSKVIEIHKGLVLQFIGDEIEAVFGAPLDLENHPEMAVNAALEMRRQLEKLNRIWVSQGGEPFRHGIGIHTGQVVAANIGNPERLSYLLVGDTVNVASRIQEMTKDVGCDILISQETRDKLSNSLNIERVGRARMRGKQEETEIYRVP